MSILLRTLRLSQACCLTSHVVTIVDALIYNLMIESVMVKSPSVAMTATVTLAAKLHLHFVPQVINLSVYRGSGLEFSI